ncbi:MAG: hypothetical protein Q7S64_01765 [bacterium]|nr:hypothetical protein [bacterium]
MPRLEHESAGEKRSQEQPDEELRFRESIENPEDTLDEEESEEEESVEEPDEETELDTEPEVRVELNAEQKKALRLVSDIIIRLSQESLRNTGEFEVRQQLELQIGQLNTIRTAIERGAFSHFGKKAIQHFWRRTVKYLSKRCDYYNSLSRDYWQEWVRPAQEAAVTAVQLQSDQSPTSEAAMLELAFNEWAETVFYDPDIRTARPLRPLLLLEHQRPWPDDTDGSWEDNQTLASFDRALARFSERKELSETDQATVDRLWSQRQDLLNGLRKLWDAAQVQVQAPTNEDKLTQLRHSLESPVFDTEPPTSFTFSADRKIRRRQRQYLADINIHLSGKNTGQMNIILSRLSMGPRPDQTVIIEADIRGLAACAQEWQDKVQQLIEERGLSQAENGPNEANERSIDLADDEPNPDE